MTAQSYDPREIMSRAANTEKGLTISFTSSKMLNHFRARCYSARKKDQDQLAKGLEGGGGIVTTGWEELVFFIKKGNKLWIGKPEKEVLGILEVVEEGEE
jgi:hypothetical protein